MRGLARWAVSKSPSVAISQKHVLGMGLEMRSNLRTPRISLTVGYKRGGDFGSALRSSGFPDPRGPPEQIEGV